MLLKRRRLYYGLTLASCSIALTATMVQTARAADPPTQESQDVDEQLVVPDGDVKALLAFIDQIRKSHPPRRADDPRGKAVYRAVEKATARIAEIATEEDMKLPGYQEAIGLHFQFRTREAFRSDAERRRLCDDLKAYYAETAEPSSGALMAARKLCAPQEYAGHTEEAVRYYRELGAALAKHENEQAATAGRRLLGAARRLELLGRPLAVTGTKLDGTKLDWKQFQGKVVLVDFWATWCGPCTREFPAIRKFYDKYHEQGFEVVGISVDEDRAALEAYLAKESLPWVTLNDGDFEHSPLAIDLGLSGIPTTLLVDRQGNVVSLEARGDKLDQKMAELFGAGDE